jgi:subtilisin family serine protease
MGTMELATALASRPEVAGISANHPFQLDEPMINPDALNQPDAVEPNISFVKADQVWSMGFTGQGTVIAGNDTGLYWSHPAFIRQYRGCLNPPECTSIDHNYSWWDAIGTYPSVPNDGHGHGTHTTRTMVGDDGGANQIGIAPGARTVHCKNMTNSGSGSDATFLSCFQWGLAPWDLTGQNPHSDLAPDAINNSWRYSGGSQNQFRRAVDALLAAGIVVEVSAGNEGASCQSLRSPGDYQEVFTTGSINHASAWPGSLTGFSSRGPSDLDGNYFPDFIAPGENLRSSVPGGGYEGSWSCTSMAGPHVTALVGLIWSANPALRGQIQITYDIIQQTVAPLTGQNGSNCGGDYTIGPNNDWGYGTIYAMAAVQMAITYGGAGVLEGTVTDSESELPVVGASITASRQEGGSWPDTTDENGFYQITVAAGTFDITASHPHYV